MSKSRGIFQRLYGGLLYILTLCVLGYTALSYVQIFNTADSTVRQYIEKIWIPMLALAALWLIGVFVSLCTNADDSFTEKRNPHTALDVLIRRIRIVRFPLISRLKIFAYRSLRAFCAFISTLVVLALIGGEGYLVYTKWQTDGYSLPLLKELALLSAPFIIILLSLIVATRTARLGLALSEVRVIENTLLENPELYKKDYSGYTGSINGFKVIAVILLIAFVIAFALGTAWLISNVKEEVPPPVTTTPVYTPEEAVVGNKVGNICPEYALPYLSGFGTDGEKYKLSSEQADVTVIYFYGTWSTMSKSTIDFINACTDSARVIAIHSANTYGVSVADYINEEYPETDMICLTDERTAKSETDTYYSMLGGRFSSPITLVINKDGIITAKFVGQFTQEQLTEAISAATPKK